MLLNVSKTGRSFEYSDVGLVVLEGVVNHISGLKFESVYAGILDVLVAESW
jgi:hypothetical protein